MFIHNPKNFMKSYMLKKIKGRSKLDRISVQKLSFLINSRKSAQEKGPRLRLSNSNLSNSNIRRRSNLRRLCKYCSSHVIIPCFAVYNTSNV